ncbi:MAG TPA: phage holin family protein [Gaiellaceae bacterium]|nr:phage holin family protein [Gaiellaceae bacterium]
MTELADAARRVAEHARSLVQLEVQLAVTEMKRKATALGIGIGLAVGALMFIGLAVLFGLAAAAVGLTYVLSVWASLLVMCGALFLMALVLAGVGVALLRRGSKPLPEQAIEEARLTREELQNDESA